MITWQPNAIDRRSEDFRKQSRGESAHVAWPPGGARLRAALGARQVGNGDSIKSSIPRVYPQRLVFSTCSRVLPGKSRGPCTETMVSFPGS